MEEETVARDLLDYAKTISAHSGNANIVLSLVVATLSLLNPEKKAKMAQALRNAVVEHRDIVRLVEDAQDALA